MKQWYKNWGWMIYVLISLAGQIASFIGMLQSSGEMQAIQWTGAFLGWWSYGRWALEDAKQELKCTSQ